MREIAYEDLRLHGTGEMNKMNLASGLTRRRGPFLRRGRGSFPGAEYFFNLVEHRLGRKIAH